MKSVFVVIILSKWWVKIVVFCSIFYCWMSFIVWLCVLLVSVYCGKLCCLKWKSVMMNMLISCVVKFILIVKNGLILVSLIVFWLKNILALIFGNCIKVLICFISWYWKLFCLRCICGSIYIFNYLVLILNVVFLFMSLIFIVWMFIIWCLKKWCVILNVLVILFVLI